MKSSLKKLTEKFEFVNKNITEELFPCVEVSKDAEYKLFHFGVHISSLAVIEKMKEEGYRPANIYELLTWKDWDHKNVVLALSSISVVGKFPDVPYITGDDEMLSLRLRCFDGEWGDCCYFLAVRD